jgi:FkbM family methyltransferase
MVAVLTMIKVISALKYRLKILIECLILFINRKSGKYIFNFNDIYLYYLEKIQFLFPIRKKKFKNFFEISISNKKIFWPKSIDHKDLPWLYHEVFDPFDRNPSSYNNPKMLIQKKDWIIDAGAAEGYFSIFAAEKTKYRATILALEPLSIMRDSLLQTAKLNNIKYFKHLPFALSDKEGEVLFNQDSEHICDSKINEKNIKSDYTELVTVTTIDKVIKDQKLFGNGLIKMDIEGLEMKALEGAKNTLRTFKPSLAIAVYHEYDNANKCAEIIQNANPEYKVELRGCYGYFKPARPYMLFAW